MRRWKGRGQDAEQDDGAGGAAAQQAAAFPLHPSVRRDYSLGEESRGAVSSAVARFSVKCNSDSPSKVLLKYFGILPYLNHP